MPKFIDLEKIKPIDFPSTEMDGLDVVLYLNTLPTVDAVEVVRCKECKHFWHYKRTQMHVDGKSFPAGMCHLWSKIDSEYPVLPDDFCSHGKRGENCITKHPELLHSKKGKKK